MGYHAFYIALTYLYAAFNPFPDIGISRQTKDQPPGPQELHPTPGRDKMFWKLGRVKTHRDRERERELEKAHKSVAGTLHLAT